MDKTDRLDPAQAGRDELPYQMHLVGGLDYPRLVLKSVAGSDLNQLNSAGGETSHLRSHSVRPCGILASGLASLKLRFTMRRLSNRDVRKPWLLWHRARRRQASKIATCPIPGGCGLLVRQKHEGAAC